MSWENNKNSTSPDQSLGRDRVVGNSKTFQCVLPVGYRSPVSKGFSENGGFRTAFYRHTIAKGPDPIAQSLGARGHLPGGYIEDTLRFFKQFVHTLPGGYMLVTFEMYPPL